MAFKWKTWTAGWLLGICWLMLPAILVAEDGVTPDAEALSAEVYPDIMKMFGEPNPDSTGMDFAPPDGSALPAPTTIRQWTIRDDDAEPYCFDLPADIARLARPESIDIKGEPIHTLFGENNLKVRLRSHPDVAARHYADVLAREAGRASD